MYTMSTLQVILHVHSEYIIHAVLHVHKEYNSSYTNTCTGSISYRWYYMYTAEYTLQVILHVHKEYTSSYTNTCTGSRWQVVIELIIEVHRVQDIGMSYKINKEDNLNIINETATSR